MVSAAPGEGQVSARSRFAVLLLASFAAFVLLLALPPISGAAAGCQNANATPHSISLAKIRAAITCLVNQQRTNRGLPALRTQTQLHGAAVKHNSYMLLHECFQHDCPGEQTFEQRISASGYLSGATRYGTAENIGYGYTPKQMITTWMRSSGHKANILNSSYRDVGVGVGWGCPDDPALPPCDDSYFATYTTDFGWRAP